jgi:tetratricopeptide (TPR) repeat protein
MSGQHSPSDGISRDAYGFERFADRIIACKRWSERRDICREYARQLDEERLDALANQLKSLRIDPRLQTQLREARTLALALQLLGKTAQRPHCVALGLLARADVDRQRGANIKAIALYNRAAQTFLDANDRAGWARARGGRLLAMSYAGQVTRKDLLEMEEVCQALREAGQLDRLASVQNNIGMAWQQLSYFQEALDAFEEGKRTV